MLHHLPIEVKRSGLREIHRVLKKGGRLFISDFCSPHVLTLPLMASLFIWSEPTRYQLFGRLPGLVKSCGFNELRRIKKGLLLEYYIAVKTCCNSDSGGRGPPGAGPACRPGGVLGESWPQFPGN